MDKQEGLDSQSDSGNPNAGSGSRTGGSQNSGTEATKQQPVRAHWTFVITVLGGLYLVLFGFNLSDMGKKADDLKRTMEDADQVVEMAKVRYPAFYVAYLEQQLWSVIEEFSINNDPISIARIDKIISTVRPFLSHDPSPETRSDTIVIRTQAYATIFGLLQRINDQQKVIAHLEDSSGRREAVEDRIRVEFETIWLEVDRKLMPVIPQAGAWLEANTYILMARHGIDSDMHLTWLRRAQIILEKELKRKPIKDTVLNLWRSELRTSLAISLSDLSASNPRYAYLLDSAISLLEKNIAEGQNWDPSIYNNLADYFGRKALTALADSKAESRLTGNARDTHVESYIMSAEAASRRAVARNLGEPVYRVTLFEILCLKQAVLGYVEKGLDSIKSQDRLEEVLHGVFDLEYTDFYTWYLFDTVSNPLRGSQMMKHFCEAEPTMFAALQSVESTLRASYPVVSE